MNTSILNDNKKYTFSDYFEMNNPTDEILNELGYSFSMSVIDLPEFHDFDKSIIKNLQDTFYTVFPRIPLNSEIAKREFLIAPLLLELVKNSQVKININDKLSGFLDYLLRNNQDLIVIEAKKKDIDNGFNHTRQN